MKIFPDLQPRRTDIDPDAVKKNVESNLAHKGFVEAMTPADVGATEESEATIAIVNPGPSLKTEDALSKLKNRKDENGNPLKIVLGNAGYIRFNQGVFPHADAFIVNHPDNDPLGFDGFGEADITYYVASLCQPHIIPFLEEKGRDVRIWHAHLDGVSTFSDDKVSLGTGSGAPVAALALYAAMGHTKFQIFGMDGSTDYGDALKEGSETEAYLERLENTQKGIKVGGTIYTVPEEFWVQTQEIMQFMTDYPDAVQSIHFSGGNTVNTAIFNHARRGPSADGNLIWSFPEIQVLNSSRSADPSVCPEVP